MMSIYKQELKQNKTATLIWTAALSATAALYISLYPGIAANPDINKVVKEIPQAFKKSFGLSGNSLTTFPALYGLVMNLVILIGAVQAMSLAVAVISRESRDKTADFLLSKPIARYNIVTQKLLAAATLLFFTNLIYIGVTWRVVSAVLNNPWKFSVFFHSSLTLLVVQSFFYSLGFFLGTALPRIKSVISLTLPVVFGFYIFGLLDDVIGEKIKYMTPFKFFDLSKLTTGGGWQAGILVYSGTLMILGLIGCYLIYQKKDIHII